LCDEKGRIGGRIHWLDLLLGLAVLVLLVRTVVQAWPRVDQKKTATVRLEVAAEKLHPNLAAGVAVGQWIKDGKSGEFMGKVIKKTTLSETAPRPQAFGEIDPQESATIVDLLLVLERTGKVVEREGIFFGRETIRAGQERMFHTLYVEFPGRINRIAVVYD
jgi:hypothetical protein